MIVRRKPTETKAWNVQTLRGTEGNPPVMPEEIMSELMKGNILLGESFQVKTPNGWAVVNESDTLILAADGHIYPCSSDDFESGYEILDSDVVEG